MESCLKIGFFDALCLIMFVVTSSFEGCALAGLRPQEGLDLLLIPLQIDESFGIQVGPNPFQR